MNKLIEKIRENYDEGIIGSFILGGLASLSLTTGLMLMKQTFKSTKCVLDYAKKEK